jgi:diadenosine tetraphosphate (Ap4A) HIT family hydrolase
MKKCIFCDFVSKKEDRHNLNSIYGSKKAEEMKHEYIVINLIDSKDLFSFLTPPDNLGESKILVIPKRHYGFLEDVPKETLELLILKVQKIVNIVRKNYGDCKILLNNGRNAEQWVEHVHFHIIPKKEENEILWKNLSPSRHLELSKQLKSKLKS